MIIHIFQQINDLVRKDSSLGRAMPRDSVPRGWSPAVNAPPPTSAGIRSEFPSNGGETGRRGYSTGPCKDFDANGKERDIGHFSTTKQPTGPAASCLKWAILGLNQ